MAAAKHRRGVAAPGEEGKALSWSRESGGIFHTGWVGAAEAHSIILSPVLKQRGKKHPKSECKCFILAEDPLCC